MAEDKEPIIKFIKRTAELNKIKNKKRNNRDWIYNEHYTGYYGAHYGTAVSCFNCERWLWIRSNSCSHHKGAIRHSDAQIMFGCTECVKYTHSKQTRKKIRKHLRHYYSSKKYDKESEYDKDDDTDDSQYDNESDSDGNIAVILIDNFC